MFMVPMRWSSFSRRRACPSISWERNSSAISRQPADTHQQQWALCTPNRPVTTTLVGWGHYFVIRIVFTVHIVFDNNVKFLHTAHFTFTPQKGHLLGHTLVFFKCILAILMQTLCIWPQGGIVWTHFGNHPQNSSSVHDALSRDHSAPWCTKWAHWKPFKSCFLILHPSQHEITHSILCLLAWQWPQNCVLCWPPNGDPSPFSAKGKTAGMFPVGALLL